jgi:hypothetical protein
MHHHHARVHLPIVCWIIPNIIVTVDSATIFDRYEQLLLHNLLRRIPGEFKRELTTNCHSRDLLTRSMLSGKLYHLSRRYTSKSCAFLSVNPN